MSRAGTRAKLRVLKGQLQAKAVEREVVGRALADCDPSVPASAGLVRAFAEAHREEPEPRALDLSRMRTALESLREPAEDIDTIAHDHEWIDALALPDIPIPPRDAPLRALVGYLIRRGWRRLMAAIGFDVWPFVGRTQRHETMAISAASESRRSTADLLANDATEVDDLRREDEAKRGGHSVDAFLRVVSATREGLAPSDNAVRITLAAMAREDFDSGKLGALRFSLGSSTLTASGARRLLDEFRFDSSRISALRIMRDLITDPENWQELMGAFDFDSSRQTARKLAPRTPRARLD